MSSSFNMGGGMITVWAALPCGGCGNEDRRRELSWQAWLFPGQPATRHAAARHGLLMEAAANRGPVAPATSRPSGGEAQRSSARRQASQGVPAPGKQLPEVTTAQSFNPTQGATALGARKINPLLYHPPQQNPYPR